MKERYAYERSAFEKRHAPRCCHTPGADTAVVCIHGILGSPAQFDFLKETALEAGCAFIALRLPGHGGSGRAFAASCPKVWKAYVLEALAPLKKQYKRLLLVGHSMGGLLALYAADTTPVGIDGLFLLALALRMKISAQSIKTACAVMLGRKNSQRRREAMRTQGVMPPPLPGYVLWLPNFAKLLHFSREIESRLQYIDKDVSLLFSAKDESVRARSANAAQKRLARCSVTTLPDSSHFSYSPSDQAAIQSSFAAFIKAHRTGRF